MTYNLSVEYEIKQKFCKNKYKMKTDYTVKRFAG